MASTSDAVRARLAPAFASCRRLFSRSKGSDSQAAKKPPAPAAMRRVLSDGSAGSSPVSAIAASLAWSLHAIMPQFMDMPRKMFGARPL